MKMSKGMKKLLAGILCAGMIFQSMSVGAFANENIDVDSRQVDEILTEAFSQADESEENRESDTEEMEKNSETVIQVQSETETAGMTETDTSVAAIEESEIFSENSTEVTTEEDIAESELVEETIESATSEEAVLLGDNEQPDYTKLRMNVEGTYYYYENDLYVFAKLEDCEIPETDVDVKFFIDEEEIAGVTSDNGYYFFHTNKTNVPAGTHILKVVLSTGTDETKTELVNRVARFETEDTGLFLEKSKYYMGASDESLEITAFSAANDIQSMELVRNGETVAKATDQVVTGEKTDPRYSGIGKDLEIHDSILYKSVWSLQNLKNSLDTGSYSIHITFTNGATVDLNNAVEVASKAIVTKCTIGADYDNTSEYVYLYIQGSGFHPSQV